MIREEIKSLILRRAYAGAFEDGVEDYFNLDNFAAENGIDNDEAWKAYQELEDNDLIGFFAGGGLIMGTPRGLLYAEQHKIVDEALVGKQNKIRTKLLVTLADIQERSAHGTNVHWETWIREAGVSKQDFHNNDKILRDLGLVKEASNTEYEMAPAGMEKVRDYRCVVNKPRRPHRRSTIRDTWLSVLTFAPGYEYDRVSSRGRPVLMPPLREHAIHKSPRAAKSRNLAYQWECANQQFPASVALPPKRSSEVDSRAGNVGEIRSVDSDRAHAVRQSIDSARRLSGCYKDFGSTVYQGLGPLR